MTSYNDIVSYFTSKGYAPHHAAGIAGNLAQESTLDPSIVNKTSGAFGLAQWLGSRKRQLKQFAQANDGSVHDPRLQLDFIDWELNNTESRARRKLLQTRSPEEAANVFSDHFERAGKNEKNNARRQRNAREALASWTGGSYAGGESGDYAGGDGYEERPRRSFEEWKAQKLAKTQPQPQPQPQQYETEQPVQAEKPRRTFEEWKAEKMAKQGQPRQGTQADLDYFKQQPTEQTEQPKKSLTAGEVAQGAITNLPSSTWNMVKGLGSAIAHPIDTAQAIVNTGAGAISNMLPEALQQEGDKEGRAMASQLADVYKQRYGTLEGFKEVLANDPASILMDASMLAGGVGLGAKAAKMPRAASLADKVAINTNPLMLPAKGVQLVGKGIQSTASNVASPILGMTTGVGAESIREAARAGAAGGSKQDALINNMRGNASTQDVLSTAKTALNEMYGEGSKAYRTDIAPVFADKTVLNFTPIRTAMNDIENAGQYKGVSINTKTSAIKNDIKSVIDEWEALPPNEYHTIEGLDSLKKSLGEIRDTTEPRTPQRVIADKAYNSVKAQIEKQSPAYAEVMKNYAQAIKLNKEVERALSLGDKAMADTAIRKLQSLTRNNVNTNYGNRLSLANKLVENGAPDLMAEIAGQSLNSFTPRGLAGMSLPAVGAGAMGGFGAAIPTLMAESPRLVGELSLKTGQAKRLLNKAIPNPKKHQVMKASMYSLADKLNDKGK